MASKSRPEGLEIVLSQVLVAVLTLITVVPLLAFFEWGNSTNELVVGLIVFGAWFLVISLAVPVLQKKGLRRSPEHTP